MTDHEYLVDTTLRTLPDFDEKIMAATVSQEAVDSSLNEFDEFHLYEDPEFPAVPSSVFREGSIPPNVNVEWKRPCEIVEAPYLYGDTHQQADIMPGNLADCWFLSTCAAVAREPKLIYRVLPPNQLLHGDQYSGIMFARFWRMGQWITVYFDDRLPVSADGRLLFARSSDKNEFWISLLEKAYAKLYGNYEGLEGGHTVDALVDLTGGIGERYDLNLISADAATALKRERLFKRIFQATKWSAFIPCRREPCSEHTTLKDSRRTISGTMRWFFDAYRSRGNKSNNFRRSSHSKGGLAQHHGYVVTGIASLQTNTGLILHLVKVKSPFSDSLEWVGNWAETDKRHWSIVTQPTKQRLLEEQRMDGEFWMDFNDFCREFEVATICTLGSDFGALPEIDNTPTNVKLIYGNWKAGMNAGGTMSNFERFATNPQYILQCSKQKNVGGGTDGGKTTSNECSVVISLMQETKDAGIVDVLEIGFAMFKGTPQHPLRSLKTTTQKMTPHFFREAKILFDSGLHRQREVVINATLRSEPYVIVPYTSKANVEGKFLIRYWSPNHMTVKRLGATSSSTSITQAASAKSSGARTPVTSSNTRVAGIGNETME